MVGNDGALGGTIISLWETKVTPVTRLEEWWLGRILWSACWGTGIGRLFGNRGGLVIGGHTVAHDRANHRGAITVRTSHAIGGGVWCFRNIKSLVDYRTESL
jgi:hypothetical protein